MAKPTKMPKGVDVNMVLYRVSKALNLQFETYTWENMIDDCDLTPAEAKWAKKNIDL